VSNWPLQSGERERERSDFARLRRAVDEAFKWLKRACAQRDGGFSEMKGDPLLKISKVIRAAARSCGNSGYRSTREAAVNRAFPARHRAASQSEGSRDDYSEQDAATILPDCTLSAGTLESAAVEALDAVDGELFGSSRVPVSSSFFPT